MFKQSFLMLTLASSIFCGGFVLADEPAPAPVDRNKMRRSMPPRDGMRRGMMVFPRNEMMMTARLVVKELKTYQEKPTAENFAALEKALAAAIKEDTARRKERLEKELANLEKDQAKRASDLLAKVKSGDFKMPERPFPPRRERPDRRERPARPAENK